MVLRFAFDGVTIDIFKNSVFLCEFCMAYPLVMATILYTSFVSKLVIFVCAHLVATKMRNMKSDYLNSSPPRAAYMRKEIGSALIQILACRLFGAWWVNWTLRNKFQGNFNRNTKLFMLENASENIVYEMAAILSRGNELNYGDGGCTSSTIYNTIQSYPYGILDTRNAIFLMPIKFPLDCKISPKSSTGRALDIMWIQQLHAI